MSKQHYIKLTIPVSGETAEIVIALLSEVGPYDFEEKSDVLDAYITEEAFDRELLVEQLGGFLDMKGINLEPEIIPPTDWNESWEKNFQGIVVGDFCEIHPPFKQAGANVKYSLVIWPKMSFGTGHHATTRLIIQQLKQLEIKGKRVLDQGCGTGILGILASKMGAKEVFGIDIDAWCMENAAENILLNEIENMKLLPGGAESIPKGGFDVIIANINRNVLLSDGDKYVKKLNPNGRMILSGFYNFDESVILDHYQGLGMQVVRRLEEDNWVSLVLAPE